MSYSIHIIGSVDGANPHEAEEIRRTLEADQANLTHGAEFTGRPATQLYLNPDSVLKVRNEIRLDPRSALRWAQMALDKERSYGVHHPGKTWFVATPLEAGTTETPLIGNICPRLVPLHILLNRPDPSATELDSHLAHIRRLFERYFRVAAEFKLRLDEGLSNFGLDANGELYYLDDDTYNWDRLVSCAHMLGVFIRSLTWLRGEYATRLGQSLRTLIDQNFKELQYNTVLAEQLRNVFMPAGPQHDATQRIIDELTRRLSQSKPLYQPRDGYQSARYLALLADVHANLPALEAVLGFLKRENIKNGLVLGDSVGYGPYPVECLGRLQESGFVVLKGNHDQGLATGNFNKGFSSSANWALEWSSRQVSETHREWLRELPPVLHTEHWTALHGAPIDPTFFNAYVYDMTYEQNLEFMQERGMRLCFHGHTHLAGVYARRAGRQDQRYEAEVLDLKGFSQALVCPGSVGQPRNHVAGARFAVYDQQEDTVHFQMQPYAVEGMLGLMEQEGFPPTLIRILRETR